MLYELYLNIVLESKMNEAQKLWRNTGKQKIQELKEETARQQQDVKQEPAKKKRNREK